MNSMQGRRVLLPARAFLGQHAHFVPGAPHQQRLELVVAEIVGAVRPRRQVAMRHERRDADDRVVAPIGAAFALPPGAAERVGAHAEPHAELEHARERAGRRHADHQALQDAELRLDLHDAHHAQDRLGGLERVRVEHVGEIVFARPSA